MEWTGEADAVFRGGGVKGLGLAGALIGFATYEDPGKQVKKWVNVAGASAGAIIAAFIACNRDVEDVGTAMLKILDPKTMASFQDFPLHSKALGISRLVVKHGMAPGDAFEHWLDGVLSQKTFKDVIEPDALAENGWKASRLKLIACDVTNRRLLVLPEDLTRYRVPPAGDEPRDKPAIDPAAFRISHAARMSMSIPYFFQPIELELMVDDDGKPLEQPVRSSIVDGGTLSNFPVWLFDSATPKRPTFGFTLSGGSGVGAGFNSLLDHALPWAGRFALEIFHTAEEAWDARFSTHSTNVRTVVVDATVEIDGQPHAVGTTDFDMAKNVEDALVANGKQAAHDFLRDFDISKYMNTFHVGGGGNGSTAAGSPAPATPSPGA
jgi:NTE family protein